MKARKVGGGCDYRGRTFAASALRRFRRAGLLFIVFYSCLLGAGSASAAVGHGFVSSFSTPDFVEPSTVTVDQADGRVFVGDPFAGVVEVFDGSGKLLTQLGGGELEIEALGVAVDEVSGDVYIADRSDEGILVFKPNGASGYSLLSEWTGERLPDKTFGEVTGVAVDNAKSSSAGDVYVLDAEDQSTEQPAVDVFKPRPAGPEEGAEGELVTQIVSGQLEEPNGVAVSKASGAVFVADSAKGAVFKFSTAGLLEAKFNGKGSPQGSFFGPEEEEGNVSAIALDESTGDLLVAEAERHVVSELNAAGEWVGWVTGTPTGAFMEPRGVATGPTGDVYVADALASVVDVFGPGALVPDVVTGKTSKVTRTTATLSGGIDGDGQPAKSHFQWGTSEDELVNSTPVTGSAAGEEKASAVISGLHPDTAYFFRIVGENENGSNVGVIREFETPTAVEGVSTGVVLSLQPEGATLTGSLKPNGLDAHYFFEWGTTTGYGNASPAPPGVDAGSEKAPVTAEAALSGLTPNTVYHYRIVTENELGITHGEDRKFSTSGPPRITIEPVTGLGHNEATVNVKINPGELATSYHIEYGETTAYGHEFPAGGGSIPAGEAPVAVSAAFTGLKIGTTYHYRVVASNSVPPVSMSADQTFTTVPPAPVDASFVSQVSASGATLHAAINPLGHDTHFYFQYGTESCAANPAGCTDVPAPPGTDIGAGEVDVAEEQALTGLSPDTTYFYRAIDSNTLGTTEGPEHTFKTMVEEPTFVLPDGRAWEMVTPPVKNAPVEPLTKEGGMILASENGNQFAYVINGAQGEDVEGNRSPEVGEVLATRSAGAWSSQDIATPSTKAKGVTVGQVPEYQLFTPDLSLALVEPAGKTPAPPLAEGVTQTTMYVRDNATRTYMPVVTNQNTAPGTNFNEQQVHFVNATLDLSHLVLASKVALLGEGSTQGLYEWSAGQLQQVSILPSQLPASGLVEMGYRNTAANAISTDGSRVLWTNVGGSSEERQGALYMRETVHGETVRLDVAQGVAEPSGSPEARFQTASADGSRVFFTDKFKLTPDSTAEPAGQGGQPDLYECEMVEQAGKLACQLSDLTASANPEEHANIKGAVFGIDSDGTALYFVAQNVLAGNENGNHEQAQPGKNNLYAYRLEGGKWNHTFIAMLSSEDSPEWEVNKTANTTFLTARVSPNGRYLAFMSAAPITGYDNTDLHSGKPDEEVFLYDSQAVSLRCVSCNPTGARPTGVFDTLLAGEGLGLLVDRRRVWGEPAHEHWLAGNIPGWTAQSVQSALIQPRYLNDQGRMFFNSPDELVPQAKNGKENVYEYEPSGVGSCQSATGGCVSLISSGTSSEESAFMEATPDGSNVFFITAAALLPQDTDSTFDIYDARVCTAESPCQTPPPPAPEPCGTEEACRLAPPASQAPIAPGGSLTASGANLSPKAPTGSQGVKGSKTTSKSNLPTRQQKLAKALKVCRRQHSKKKRQACENHARKLYGPKHAATKSKAKHASTQTAKRSGR